MQYKDKTFNDKLESGEIFACKGQGRKTTLLASDLRSHRQHCIKNACIMDSATWAQGHLENGCQ